MKILWKNSQIFGRSDIFYSQLNPKGSSWPCYYPAYANAAGRPCLKRPSKKERKKEKKERNKERKKERKTAKRTKVWKQKLRTPNSNRLSGAQRPSDPRSCGHCCNLKIRIVAMVAIHHPSIFWTHPRKCVIWKAVSQSVGHQLDSFWFRWNETKALDGWKR